MAAANTEAIANTKATANTEATKHQCSITAAAAAAAAAASALAEQASAQHSLPTDEQPAGWLAACLPATQRHRTGAGACAGGSGTPARQNNQTPKTD